MSTHVRRCRSAGGIGGCATLAPGGDRQLRRSDRRLVRLPALRLRRRHRLQHPVLPQRRSPRGHAGGLRHLRRRLPVPPARRHPVRPLRRPLRPPHHVGDHRNRHGARLGGDRPVADLCFHRLVGRGVAGAAAHRARHGGRRRMGRRSADGRGERARRQEGVLQQRRPGRLRRGAGAHHRHHAGDQQDAEQRGLPVLGLAAAVPVQHRAGGHRAVDPVEYGRIPRVRGEGRRARRAHASSCRWSSP